MKCDDQKSNVTEVIIIIIIAIIIKRYQFNLCACRPFFHHFFLYSIYNPCARIRFPLFIQIQLNTFSCCSVERFYTVTWSCPFVNRHTMINLISFNGLFIALYVVIKIISLSLWCDKLDTIYENCNNNNALYKIKHFMSTEFTVKWTMAAKKCKKKSDT